MAAESRKQPARETPGAGDRREAEAPGETAADVGDPAAGGESSAEVPPPNRAARRLAAKGKKAKKGQGFPRGPQKDPGGAADGMRGRGVKGAASSPKGTNTRRSG